MGVQIDPTVACEYQKLYGWTRQSTNDIVTFVIEELSDSPPHLRVKQLSQSMIKVAAILSSHNEPIWYFVRNPEGWPLERRDLKKEILNCAADIQRKLERTTKPDRLTPIEWVLINVAPFFRHTDKTASKNIGRISWRHLAKFLGAAANYHRHFDTLRKQYKSVSSIDYPRNVILAHHHDSLVRRRNKMRPRKFSVVLHKQASKRFHLLKISGTLKTEEPH